MKQTGFYCPEGTAQNQSARSALSRNGPTKWIALEELSVDGGDNLVPHINGVGAETLHCPDGGKKDQRDDQAIFDSRGATMVGP
jgi:hypothetical protein